MCTCTALAKLCELDKSSGLTWTPEQWQAQYTAAVNLFCSSLGAQRDHYRLPSAAASSVERDRKEMVVQAVHPRYTHCLSNRTSSRPASCGQMWRGLMQDSLISPCSSQTRGMHPDNRRFALRQAGCRRHKLEQRSELACSRSRATRQRQSRQ